jgi:hypothetical protein
MVTSLTIALAISLTGQVETKLCNLKCTGHTKEVIREKSLDITQDPKYMDGIESGYILLCNGEAEGFTNHNTGDIVCDGTNHEEWKKYGKMGECYVCY